MKTVKFNDWESSKYYYNRGSNHRHPFLFTLKYGRIYRKQQHVSLPFKDWHEEELDVSYNYLMKSEWIEFKENKQCQI